MTTIYKASLTDAALLTALSRNIYKEHYLHLWHPGGAEWYMEEYAYARDKTAADLLDPGVEYFIALKDAAPAGYMKMVLASSLEAYENLDALEVERIYLYKKTISKGIGRKLMQVACRKQRP